LPEVPTLDEAGLKGFDIASWFGLMAPTGTPPEVISKISQSVVQMLATAEMRAQLAAAGAEPVGSTPQQMAAQIHREVARFGALARKARLELD
jgi:tripartite-type tricarboxylate transporter receptor subunit TctC